MAKALPATKTRGMPIIVPPWWLREVNRLTQGRTLEELAGDLTALAARNPPWDRSTIGKFLKNKYPTWELMHAFSVLLDLPIPIVIARSPEEASHLIAESRKYDEGPDVKAINLEKRERYLELEQELAKMERDVASQIMRNPSLDGKLGRRPRRGVAHSRPPTSRS